jgi:phage-related protein
MASGFLIASAHVDVEANTANAIRSITSLVTKLTTVGPVAVAAGAAATAALGGIAAGATAAGLATGAFALAAKPQMEQVTEVTKLQEAAMKAAAAGSEDAAEKQKAYEQALSKLPPATRATAVAMGELKDAHQKWSDSLAGDTMPVFTSGLQTLKGMLPGLTPLVKVASKHFKSFIDDMKAGVEGGGFAKFMEKVADLADKVLPDFLETIKQVGRGLKGMFEAFMPHADGFTNKMTEMATKFGDFGAKMGESNGFSEFMDYAKEHGPVIAETLGDIAKTVGNVVLALAPLTGVTLPVLAQLAEWISKIPPPVLTGIAVGITAIRIAMMIWSTYLWLTTSAFWPLITATWAWTTALLANPITWIVIGIVALIAIIVLIATKTDWFQKLWSAAWNWIKSAWDTVWNALKAGWNAMGRFFTETIPGWLTSLKNWFITKWTEIRTKVSEVWNAILEKIKSIWNMIINWVQSKVNGFVNLVKDGFTKAKNWVADLGSQIVSKVKSAFTSVVNAVRDKIRSAVDKVKEMKDKVLNFFSGAKDWLYNSGKKIIEGLISGIKNMAGRVKDAVKGVLDGARNLLPFSPAKEGPFSGKGWTEYSGASLMDGLATGIDNNSKRPYQSMSNALGTMAGPIGNRPAAATGGGNVTYGDINISIEGVIDITKASAAKEFAEKAGPALKEWMRKSDKERI